MVSTAGTDTQPASVTTRLTTCRPLSGQETSCGPAVLSPGMAVPPSKSHAKVAFAEAPPVKVTVTSESVQVRLSIAKAATGVGRMVTVVVAL